MEQQNTKKKIKKCNFIQNNTKKVGEVHQTYKVKNDHIHKQIK